MNRGGEFFFTLNAEKCAQQAQDKSWNELLEENNVFAMHS